MVARRRADNSAFAFATPALVILGEPYLRESWAQAAQGRVTSSALVVLGGGHGAGGAYERGGRQARAGQQNPSPAHLAARQVSTDARKPGRVDAIG